MPWFASYRDDQTDASAGWLVASALARCLRASGTPSEAGTVAVLSRRLLDELEARLLVRPDRTNRV